MGERPFTALGSRSDTDDLVRAGRRVVPMVAAIRFTLATQRDLLLEILALRHQLSVLAPLDDLLVATCFVRLTGVAGSGPQRAALDEHRF
jgi:hypothetical protein